MGNGDLGVTVGAVTGDDGNEELVLYLGLSQMWGVDAYNHTHDIDEVFPRRLGIGSIRIRAAEKGMFDAASFNAVQDIEKGEVTATLTASTAKAAASGAAAVQPTLSIRVYLHPSENVAITEISCSDASIQLNITMAVLPLKRLCRTTPHGE